MAELKFVAGRDFRSLEQWVDQRLEQFKNRAESEISDAVQEGAELTRDNLEKASTKTGSERAQRGGNGPGRHDSGNLINAVNDNGGNLERDGDVTMGSFGWFASNYPSYAKFQEEGTSSIPPASALYQAFVQEREKFKARIDRLAK